MIRLRIYLLIILSLPLISLAQNYSNIDFARHISEKDLEKKVKALCSNRMQGRETGTKGQKQAAAYIYSQFKAYGLKAIDKSNDSLSYFQTFNLSKLRLPSGSIQINKKTFYNYKDFVADPIQDSIYEELDVIFIGNSSIENYTDIDFTKKAVLFLTSNFHKAFSQAQQIWKHSHPKLILFSDPINNKLFYKFINLKKRIRDKRFRLNKLKNYSDSINYKQIIPISARLAKAISGLKLKQLRKIVKNEVKQEIIQNQLIYKLNKNNDIIKTENVLAMIEGSETPDEYIIISAHYDHLGKHNRRVFQGANDNASGTAAMLEIAKAFKSASKENKTPKRSIIFVAFTGEEKGLLGSRFFVNNSPIPLKSIKTNLNMDMLGRIDSNHKFPDYIYLLGTSDLKPSLKAMCDSLNDLQPQLNLDYKYDSPHNAFYGASDQASFVSKGIPAIMYFNGLHQDYHTEKDTPDKLNYKNIERVARLVFLTAWELANQP